MLTKAGTYEITFTNIDADTLIDINFGGLKVFMFCDGFIDTFISVFKTLLCFLGGLGDDPTKKIMGTHVPPYMEKANVEFLNETMGYLLVERTIQDVEIDESLIQSGDFLAIMRLDGLDPIIMYGSGSHAGHSTMAIRDENGDLFIIESQDAWYWPTHGIQKNPFSVWIQNAKNADFHVTHMPLTAEARAKFNATAAWEFFNSTEGNPYGYHNFLFGWIDTAENNWPPILPSYFVPIAFSVVGKIAPNTIDIFYYQALNIRLGTTGLGMEDIVATAAERNMTIDDLMAVPEQDGWLYHGLMGDQEYTSYVCSAYVTAVYKAAGIFDDYVLQGTEFTPRDVYSLGIYDVNWQRPQVCQDADPDQPFCQLLGKYRMTFPGYSTITPYPHMDEVCPTLAPIYTRPDGC